MSKESLEVLARMTDTPIKVREVVDKWLLLTYDLPNTEEGNRARTEFLQQAAAVGASRHTDSVYLMPWSPEAEQLALCLADIKGGEVVVWAQAEPVGENASKLITEAYDDRISKNLHEISERLDKMHDYKKAYSLKRVIQMSIKTSRLMDEARVAIERRGSDILAAWLEILKTRYSDIMKR